MKVKIIAVQLCVCLFILTLAGCSGILPNSSNPSATSSSDGTTDSSSQISATVTTVDGSANSDTASSPAANSSSTNSSIIVGVVENVSGSLVTVDLVTTSAAAATSSSGSTSDDAAGTGTTTIANTIKNGSFVYTLTGKTDTLSVTSNAAIVLEKAGNIAGSVIDIKAGDFLVAFLNNNAVIVIVDNGPVIGSSSASASAAAAVSSSGNTSVTNGKTYQVTVDSLKIRSGPSTSDSVLGKLALGSKETGVVTNGWLKFTYNGKDAYCLASYLKPYTNASTTKN